MIIKAILVKKIIDEEIVWCASYLNKDTGHNTILRLYPKDIPYLSVENLQENSQIKISTRYYSEKTKFLFPPDIVVTSKYIDSGQYYLVAKIIFVTSKVKYKTVQSVLSNIDDEERLQWNDFYLSLVSNFPDEALLLTSKVKHYIETFYLPPIKKT